MVFETEYFRRHQSNRSINIAKSLQEFPEAVDKSLYALSNFRHLERLADQLKNIAKEIIFFAEGKVLKTARSSRPLGEV